MDESAAAGEAVFADDGVRLWAMTQGPTDDPDESVILCHGGPGIWDTLEEPAALLEGRRVIRWDQRGCGRSRRTGPYSAARSVADLDAVRIHFGLRRTALLGHSWGAQLALRYALAHPGRVSRLVYVSGTGVDDEATWHPAFREVLLRQLGEHRQRWEELRGLREKRTPAQDREYAVLQWSADFVDRSRALHHAEAMATPWYGVNSVCNSTINAETERDLATGEVRERCASLEVPVLIVDGARDIRPRWAVDSLEHTLPDVTRTVLPGAGHMPWTEDPEGFRAAVATFLGGDVPRM